MLNDQLDRIIIVKERILCKFVRFQKQSPYSQKAVLKPKKVRKQIKKQSTYESDEDEIQLKNCIMQKSMSSNNDLNMIQQYIASLIPNIQISITLTASLTIICMIIYFEYHSAIILYQIIKMQKFISQIPELAHFLSQSSKKQHFHIIKQLLLLGIDASQTKCHTQKHRQCNDLVNQIEIIKENLHHLNHLVTNKMPTNYGCIYNPAPPAKKTNNYHEHQQSHYPPNYNQQAYPDTERVYSQPAEKDHLQQKKTKEKSTQNKFKAHGKKETENRTHNPFYKQKSNFRHHLDDTKARQVLNYPSELLVEVHHPIKRKSQDYKKHIYQEEINKEEQTKIKLHQQNEGKHEVTQRNRSQTDYHHAQSKIKSLIDKDRIRFMQKQRDESFKEGFNKYQYSDENEMEEEDSSFSQEVKEINESNKYNFNQSSFKASNKASSSHKSKPSSKKDAERSKNEASSNIQVSYGEQQFKYDTNIRKSIQKEINMPLKIKETQKPSKLYRSNDQQQEEEEQDSSSDMISNSSSFSQFSINGSRRKQIGKISRKKEDN